MEGKLLIRIFYVAVHSLLPTHQFSIQRKPPLLSVNLVYQYVMCI